MKFWLTLALLVPLIAFAQAMPDPKLTPGATSHETLAQICTKGSAKDERSVTTAAKHEVYARYHTAPCKGVCAGRQGCEVDHLVSLELGGSNELENLWVQPYDGDWNAHDKDRLENELHTLVCAKKVALNVAQEEIRTDWVRSYKKHIGTTRKPFHGPARCP